MKPEESLFDQFEHNDSLPSQETLPPSWINPTDDLSQILEQVRQRELQYQQQVIRDTKSQLLRLCSLSFRNGVPQKVTDCVDAQNDIEILHLATLHALNASTFEELEILVAVLKGESNELPVTSQEGVSESY